MAWRDAPSDAVRKQYGDAGLQTDGRRGGGTTESQRVAASVSDDLLGHLLSKRKPDVRRAAVILEVSIMNV